MAKFSSKISDNSSDFPYYRSSVIIEVIFCTLCVIIGTQQKQNPQWPTTEAPSRGRAPQSEASMHRGIIHQSTQPTATVLERPTTTRIIQAVAIVIAAGK